MWFIKRQLDWLHEHAEIINNDAIWRCKATGEPIRHAVVGRSIWMRPFTGGSGEVRRIMHLECTACNRQATPPKHGTPIYEDELCTEATIKRIPEPAN